MSTKDKGMGLFSTHVTDKNRLQSVSGFQQMTSVLCKAVVVEASLVVGCKMSAAFKESTLSCKW